MRNDVSFMKLRAIKRYSKLFYDWLFFFVSFGLGSLHGETGFSIGNDCWSEKSLQVAGKL